MPSLLQSFMVTPRTQENFRRIDKEFDHLLRTNQVPSANNNNTATSGTALVRKTVGDAGVREGREVEGEGEVVYSPPKSEDPLV